MISLWQIFLVFAKIGAFTIGGGIPMIAAIKSELVQRGWLNDEDFVDIITLAQTAPGLFAVNISILTGHRLRGTKGSVVATIASCLPPFLIILLVAMFFTSYKDNPYVIKAFKGIRPVVVALIGVPMIDMLKADRGYAVDDHMNNVVFYMELPGTITKDASDAHVTSIATSKPVVDAFQPIQITAVFGSGYTYNAVTVNGDAITPNSDGEYWYTPTSAIDITIAVTSKSA